MDHVIQRAGVEFPTSHREMDTGDLWNYLKLSYNIFTDFYHHRGVTQFHFATEYFMGLPPLWSTLIGIFNLIFDLGIYAGYIINFLVSVLTFLF